MTKIYVKRHKINEDDMNNTNMQQTASSSTNQNIQNNQNQAPNNPNQKFDALQRIVDQQKANRDNKISVLQKQIDELNTQYNTAMITYRKTAEAINAELVKAQLPSRVLRESATTPLFLMGDLRFSKKLFESRKGESLVKEWQRVIYSAIEGAGTSRTPTIEELRTPARIIKNKIYDWETNKWNSEIIPKNHWPEISEFIKDYLIRNRELSYSKNEIDHIIIKLEERLRGSKSFSWIFGKNIDKNNI